MLCQWSCSEKDSLTTDKQWLRSKRTQGLKKNFQNWHWRSGKWIQNFEFKLKWIFIEHRDEWGIWVQTFKRLINWQFGRFEWRCCKETLERRNQAESTCCKWTRSWWIGGKRVTREMPSWSKWCWKGLVRLSRMKIKWPALFEFRSWIGFVVSCCWEVYLRIRSGPVGLF